VCDRPNVLNGACDPGSRFQVLVNRKNSRGEQVVIVAHCRAKGRPTGTYQDTAVIAYNETSGDTCFFQDAKPSADDPRWPAGGVPAPKDDTINFWGSPTDTAGLNCVNCHDDGPFVRTPYLTQLKGTPATESGQPEIPAITTAQQQANAKVPKAILPGSREVTGNSKQPYRFVGKDFQGWKAYSVSLQDSRIPGNTRNQCTSCHRMGLSTTESGSARIWNSEGSTLIFGPLATAPVGPLTQQKKNPHTGTVGAAKTSPIWMLPNQSSFIASSYDEALDLQKCGRSIRSGGVLPSGCNGVQYAQGNTCAMPALSVTVNGATVGPVTQQPEHVVVDIPLGPDAGFMSWTSLHGPFYENSKDIPYRNAGFDGTYAIIGVSSLGAFQVEAGRTGPPVPGPGAGGEAEGTRFADIAGITAPNSGSYSRGRIEDLIGNSPYLSIGIDSANSGIAVPVAFIGSVSRGSKTDYFGLIDRNSKTYLERTSTNPRPGEGIAFVQSVPGYTPIYSVLHRATSSDIELIAAPSAIKHRCFISGIGGDWSQTSNGGAIQPYAQVYYSSGAQRLRVASPNSNSPVTAEASCVQLKP
jgi:hypothetical protein